MEKVKIAIIDTGIDIYDSELNKYLKFDSRFQILDMKSMLEINDLHGHGTLCAKTIIKICSNVELYPMKIFNDGGETNSVNLVNALERLIDSDIDLINISAATLNPTNKSELEYICNKLYEDGKIIICSHHNKSKGQESYPTCFKSVIGVKGNHRICKDEDYLYSINEDIQMYTNSKERFFKFNNNVTHFGKNSRGAAIATGIIANIYTRLGKLKFKDLEDILIDECKISTLYKDYRFLYKKDYKSDINKRRIAQRIIKIINRHFSHNEVNLEFVETHAILNTLTQVGNYNAYKFLSYINEEFDIRLDYKDIFLYELDNLYLLVNLIYSSMNDKSIQKELYVEV